MRRVDAGRVVAAVADLLALGNLTARREPREAMGSEPHVSARTHATDAEYAVAVRAEVSEELPTRGRRGSVNQGPEPRKDTRPVGRIAQEVSELPIRCGSDTFCYVTFGHLRFHHCKH